MSLPTPGVIPYCEEAVPWMQKWHVTAQKLSLLSVPPQGGRDDGAREGSGKDVGPQG
jgi:hypothetical protein